MSLLCLAAFALGPGLALAQVVLGVVVGFLDAPAQLIYKGDKPWRQSQLGGLDAVGLQRDGIAVAHPVHDVAAVAAYCLVGDHAVVAGIGSLPPPLLALDRSRIRLLQRYYIDSLGMHPAIPLLVVDDRRIVGVDHLDSLRLAHAQSLGVDPLERGQLVLFLLSGLRLAKGDVAQRSLPEVERVYMAGSLDFAERLRLVGARGDSVPIGRIHREAENFFARIKRCRRVSTRYDRRPDTYMGFASLSALTDWIRSYFVHTACSLSEMFDHST